jgi:hypothetical protein
VHISTEKAEPRATGGRKASDPEMGKPGCLEKITLKTGLRGGNPVFLLPMLGKASNGR